MHVRHWLGSELGSRRKATYDSTASGVTDHEILARAQLVEIREVGTVDRGGLGLSEVEIGAPR